MAAVSQEQTCTVSSVTFESSTKGGYKSITVYLKKIFINKNHRAESYILDKGDWKTMMEILIEIDFRLIGEYTVPFDNSAENDCWLSEISIDSKEGVSYKSKEFNDDKSPAELKLLMSFLKRVDEKYNGENRVF